MPSAPRIPAVFLALLVPVILGQTQAKSLIAVDAATGKPVAGANVVFLDASMFQKGSGAGLVAALIDEAFPLSACKLRAADDGAVTLPAFAKSAVVAISANDLYALEIVPVDEKFPMRVLLRRDQSLSVEVVDEAGKPVPWLGVEVTADVANSLGIAKRRVRADGAGRAVIKHVNWMAHSSWNDEEPFAALGPDEPVVVGTIYPMVDRWTTKTTLGAPSPVKLTIRGPRMVVTAKDVAGALITTPLSIGFNPVTGRAPPAGGDWPSFLSGAGTTFCVSAMEVADGKLSIPWNPRDRIVVVAEDPSSRLRNKAMLPEIPAGATGGVDVELVLDQENPSITGRLLDAAGKPAPSKSLSLLLQWDDKGALRAGSGASDEAGRFRIHLGSVFYGLESRKASASVQKIVAVLRDGMPVEGAFVKFTTPEKGSVDLGDLKLVPLRLK